MKTIPVSKKNRIRKLVEHAVETTPVYDIHTHLYDASFGKILLWGIDELLTYHYLVAESFRFWNMPYDKFWKLPKADQAELIWKTLFKDRSPISEACRGVITTLNRLGLDPRKKDLPALRKWFTKFKTEDYITLCMKTAGVRKICMTNSPFDHVERPVWEKGFKRDPRFTAALRVDPLIMNWKGTVPFLKERGFDVTPELTAKTLSEVRRFLAEWGKKMDAIYCMISLPPDFTYPSTDTRSRLIAEAVLPFCRERGIPFAMMPGSVRGVNPNLQDAGDSVTPIPLGWLGALLRDFPDNKFMATVLSLDNQHELTVLTRKFRNFHIFGCWWFLNNPSIIDVMTRMRIEMLGLSVTPQHSDARVLDQIIYKWDHSRRVIGNILVEKYTDLAVAGWEATPKEIQKDVESLFGGEFERFLASAR